MLLEHGADVTGQDKDGRTPFDLASSDSGYEEVAHVLLEHGAVPGTKRTWIEFHSMDYGQVGIFF